jgi:hypothetical protein
MHRGAKKNAFMVRRRKKPKPTRSKTHARAGKRNDKASVERQKE